MLRKQVVRFAHFSTFAATAFSIKTQVSLKNSKDALQRSFGLRRPSPRAKRTVNDLFPLSDAAVSGFLDEGFFILKRS